MTGFNDSNKLEASHYFILRRQNMAILEEKRKIQTANLELQACDFKKISRIYTPLNISEQSKANGFAFSKKLAKQTKFERKNISRAFFEGNNNFEYADLMQKFESDSAGSPTVGENSITIWIDAEHVNASSNANYIYLYFGREKRVKLLGLNGAFPAGAMLSWDLNQIDEWLEDNVEADLWDELALVNESGDGIKIDRIRAKHSGQTILDWSTDIWLDGSKLEEYGKIFLTGKILEQKLEQIDNLWVPQIHWAARELGKSDGTKYGSTGAWCSEFASWCLRKAMWDTPEGNIGSQSMENYFDSINRMYSHDQLIDGDYKLVAGDYIRFEWSNGGQHSGIFVEYVDDPDSPSDATTIRTIEGNASSTVLLTTRNFQNVLSVGNCQ